MTARSVSIITAVYNGAATLENCIASVLAQSHSHIEHVVVDGGSRDGTLEILKRHEGRIRYVSGPDKGIYDAMNIGVAMASGEWVLFLGADDRLADADSIASLLAACPADLSVYTILTGVARYSDGRLYHSNDPAGLRWRNRIHHQGALYRRSALLNRPYDISLRVYADYDFNLAAWRHGARLFHTSSLISVMGPEGISDRPRWQNYREDMNVRARHVRGPALWMGNAFAVGRYVYKVLRRLARTRDSANGTAGR